MSNLSPHQFPQFQSVPAHKVPVEDDSYQYPKGSFAVAEDDHPVHEFGRDEGTYTLRHQPVDKVPFGPEEHWDDVDWRSVKTMASQLKKDPEHHTPALITHPDGEGLAGGNHRTEAYRQAGRSTIPVWERDR